MSSGDVSGAVVVACDDVQTQGLVAGGGTEEKISEPVVLDGSGLDLARIEAVARGHKAVLGPSVAEACRRSRQVIDGVLAQHEVAYGINTGFGRLANCRIEDDQVRDLQRNLILSHCAGVGPYVSDEVVRAMIALRVNALSRGYSGARLELLEALLAMLERGVLPRVPSRGSVGASGDLAPLSHMALGLLGEGEVSYRGQIMPAAEALAQAGLQPFVLEAKEGLALINGTQFMTAVGSLAMARAARLLRVADIVGAMSIEAMLGTVANLHHMVYAARPHQGQSDAAANLRRLTHGSTLILSHRDCAKVQDPYSLRCMPQVHGAAREGHRFALGILEQEMNSVTDNPLVFPSDVLGEEGELFPQGLVISGGNFHGAPVALALDTAAIAMCYIGTISERRCDKLLAGSDGLSPFLTPVPGLNSGLMIVQYAAASLVNENKVFAHPASVDTVPTSAGQEDHNSHGPTAAHKLEAIVSNLERILACELVCVVQALRARREYKFGAGTEAAFSFMSQRIAPLLEDRPPYKDIETARVAIQSGELLQAVEEALGALA